MIVRICKHRKGQEMDFEVRNQSLFRPRRGSKCRSRSWSGRTSTGLEKNLAEFLISRKSRNSKLREVWVRETKCPPIWGSETQTQTLDRYLLSNARDRLCLASNFFLVSTKTFGGRRPAGLEPRPTVSSSSPWAASSRRSCPSCPIFPYSSKHRDVASAEKNLRSFTHDHIFSHCKKTINFFPQHLTQFLKRKGSFVL